MADLNVSFLQDVQRSTKSSGVSAAKYDNMQMDIGAEFLKSRPPEKAIEDVVLVKSFDKQGFSTWIDFVEAYEFDPEQFSKKDVLRLIRHFNGVSLDKMYETGIPESVALPEKFHDENGYIIEGIIRKDSFEIPRHDRSYFK